MNRVLVQFGGLTVYENLFSKDLKYTKSILKTNNTCTTPFCVENLGLSCRGLKLKLGREKKEGKRYDDAFRGGRSPKIQNARKTVPRVYSHTGPTENQQYKLFKKQEKLRRM